MDKPAFTRALLHPRHWLTWSLIGVAVLLTRLPYKVQLSIGKAVGLLLHKVARSRRHIAEVNIRLCFPEKTASEQAQLVRRIFIDNGIGFMETMISWFRKPDYLLPITQFHGLEKLAAANAEGRGVMLLGAHYSMLDLAGTLLSNRIVLSVTYKPQGNPVMNFVMERGRARAYKNCFVSKDIRNVIRALKQGDTVWYAPDQDFGHRNSTFATFFGVPTATLTATSRIVKSGNAVVLPITYFRREDNSGYDISIHDALPIPGASDEADAQVANDFLEEQLRLHPSQYLWLHKRFKSQPGEAGERGRLYQRR